MLSPTMQDIICPNCGKAFHIDESNYQTIVSQIRNQLFEDELKDRLNSIKEQLKTSDEAKRISIEKDYDAKLAKKDSDINDLKNTITALKGEISGYNATKEAEIQTIKAENIKTLNEAIKDREKEIVELNQKIINKDHEFELKLLKAESAVKDEIHKKNEEIQTLKNNLENEKLYARDRENQLMIHHKQQLDDKEAEIERLKDFKLRLSTKMVGETLEQHCYNLFSQAQSMGIYTNAIFEKDNIAIDGTKGDFIFRDYIGEDEYVSIMFEMKNEMETTATKHRNDDFLEKLDKDRTKKKCEYAVLVSMLEQDNEVYNAGIVDKSHRYPKMLVIRPQFFLPVLRIISEGAKKGYMEKRDLIFELEKAKTESLDLSNFQQKLDNVKIALNKNYEAAHKKFVAAYEGLDKAIEGLEKQIDTLKKIKANFEASDGKLGGLIKISEDNLTFKKLTYANPTVKKLIEEANKPDTF